MRIVKGEIGVNRAFPPFPFLPARKNGKGSISGCDERLFGTFHLKYPKSGQTSPGFLQVLFFRMFSAPGLAQTDRVRENRAVIFLKHFDQAERAFLLEIIERVTNNCVLQSAHLAAEVRVIIVCEQLVSEKFK